MVKFNRRNPAFLSLHLVRQRVDHAGELRYAVTVDYKPDPAEAVKDLPIALHEGARAWYKENKIQ